MNLTYFLIIIFVILNYIYCYQKFTIENDDICSLIDKKRKVSLDDSGSEGLLVSQSRINDHSTNWLFNHACNFQVKIGTLLGNFQKPNNFGLVAVVQKLSLRKDRETGDCIDWIQFKTKHTISPKYCGDVVLDNDGNMIHMYDKHGKIETNVFIHGKRHEPNEQADLLIVYTPIKSCAELYYPFFKCSIKDVPSLCMRNEFKNDSYINCPSCTDEGESCRVKTKHSSGVGTVATIGAIVSLIISFVFFLSCIWICKRFRLFCWSHSFAAGTRSTPPTNVEMNLQGNTITTGSIGVTGSAPSAPALSIDKDLPPPYESLFPDRAGDRL